jgi:predicted nucleic-acid-binding protein
VIGLDTNVLIRHFMQDDPLRVASTAEVMSGLSPTEPGWIGLATLSEMVWVLSKVYRLRKQSVLYVLQNLIANRGIVFDRADAVLSAVHLYRAGNAEFQDCLIYASAKSAGCERVVTFDEIAARDTGMEHIS